MKKKSIILIFFLFLIIPFALASTSTSNNPTTNSEEKTPPGDDGLLPSHPSTLADDLLVASHNSTTKPKVNPWNETIIISDTWQIVIGTFFGLNLRGISTEISVRETLVLISIFVMFLIIISDILKLTPFFKKRIIFSGETLVATIVTLLVSISGALINLKDLFMNLVAYLIDKLTFGFVKESLGLSSFLTALLIIASFTFIVMFFNMISPIIEKYSRVSKARASGRLASSSKEKENNTEENINYEI